MIVSSINFSSFSIKDRHWTTREFEELTSGTAADATDPDRKRILMEVGCGAGNFVFPLLEEGADNLFIYACDFSTRAVDIVKKHPLYDEEKVNAVLFYERPDLKRPDLKDNNEGKNTET